jgi:DUF4097 and DUF4098 domain-containing protein YvlB
MPARSALVVSLGLVLALPAFAADRDIDKVNGSIEVEAGERYGQLETVNGSIRVGAGARTGDVETVNGGIRIDENVHAGSVETVNGAIRIAGGTTVTGSVGTVNGSIFIDRGSEVKTRIETVNGSIGLVAADVGGGIETVNGDVTVGIGSHVRGGLTIRKPTQWFGIGKRREPRVVIGPDARVDGPLVFEREVTLYVHDTATTGPISGARAVRFSTPTPPER